MSKIALLHTSDISATEAEKLVHEIDSPCEVRCVHDVADLQRFLRHIQANRGEYLCVVNACAGTDDSTGGVSAATAAVFLEKAGVPYTGCRAVSLGYPLDTLLMMIRYAPVSLPRYREIRCKEDISAAATALRAPVRIVSMAPCLGVVDRVVTDDDHDVVRRAMEECRAEYGPLVVLEYPRSHDRAIDVLISGRNAISAPRGASASQDDDRLRAAVAACEAAAHSFAKNVLYYRGSALLSFVPSGTLSDSNQKEEEYILSHLTLHFPLLTLPPLLRAKVRVKEVLSDCVQQAVALHPNPGYKMQLMEGEQSRMGYIMVAARDFAKDQIVFADECRSFAMVTRPHVERYWDAEKKKTFTEYAWPLDSDGHLYAMWEEDPGRWRPLNHSCDPNCIFAAPHSLNVIAARSIKAGDNLTMDYATFCDHTMKPFNCFCGASCCRGLIVPDEASLLKYGENTWLRKVPGPVKPLI